MPEKLTKLAQDAVGDGSSIDHDLDETLRLLVKHRENGYAGLGYEAKNDGQGGRTVLIRFPSPSDNAKYEAMAEDGIDPTGLSAPSNVQQDNVVPMESAAPLAAKTNSNIVVRVAMDTEKQIREELRVKYPKEFLENMEIA